MQVILRERLENLGDAGEKVDVKPGYARNYLLPRKLARLATDLGISANILGGTIEEIGTRPFGNLLISVPQDRGDQARAFLEQHGLTTEVLGHVR